MRYRIKLSYSGAGFCGWQVQPDAPSVQQTLQAALSTLLRVPEVSVTGAGRTDTGVNAIGYIAHFDAAEGLDTRQLCYKLNAILPRSVVIHDIAPAAPDFHARFDATEREYIYFLHRCKDPFADGYSYLYTFPDVDYWYFRISADRFLRNMVRAVVGTLLEVGRGKRSVDDFAALVLPADYTEEGSPGSGAREPDCDGNHPAIPLEGAQGVTGRLPAGRSRAGESVPGHALFLSSVCY